MDWDGDWIGNVPSVRNRLWLVPGVQIGNVDSLERYLVHGMRMWMVLEGAWSMVWVVVSTWRAEWVQFLEWVQFFIVVIAL
jgi:hypothetical protein